MLGYKEKNLIGLDIGPSFIKAVQLTGSKGSYTLKGMSSSRVSKYEDEVQRKTETIKSIKRCIDMNGFNSNYAVCAVNGDEAIVRSFSFNSISSEDLDGAILEELEQISPIEMEKSIVDYQVISNGNNQTTGVLVSASPDAVNEKKEFAEMASLDVVLMGVDSLATLDCFLEIGPASETETKAILCMRNAFANLIVAGSEMLPFVRTINYLDSGIIETISKKYKISEGSIRQTLLQEETEDDESSIVWDAFKEYTKDIVEDITGTMRYYHNYQKMGNVDKLYICGDYSVISAIKKIYSDQISMEMILWNPLEEVCTQKLAQKYGMSLEDGYGMSVAMGLAMRKI